MRRSAEEKREALEAKRRAWSRELVDLQRRRLDKFEYSERDVERTREANELLARVHEKMRSREFKSWYEATTGSPVDEFLADVAIPWSEWFERGLCRPGLTQLDWTRRMIELVADRHPWTDPEKRQFWVGYLDGCEDALERRRILIKLATPAWADRKKMLAFYAERDRLTALTGIPHHVDHIIPIVHPDVCGLNCELNLRVIPAIDNRIKSNLFNGTAPKQRRKQRLDKKEQCGNTAQI